jgi:hypothetical protein
MCVTSFGAVFVLLVSLALVIQLIATLFPERAPSGDAALAAAVTAAVSTAFPGMKVTRIEEKPS